MMDLRVFFDCRCQNCGLSRSEDFFWGMPSDRAVLISVALKEGWRSANGKTLCPDCAGDVADKRISVDKYYDINCDCCGLFWSTDFGHEMLPNASWIRREAYREGWGVRKGLTVCPVCIASGAYKSVIRRPAPLPVPDFSGCERINILELLSQRSDEEEKQQ